DLPGDTGAELARRAAAMIAAWASTQNAGSPLTARSIIAGRSCRARGFTRQPSAPASSDGKTREQCAGSTTVITREDGHSSLSSLMRAGPGPGGGPTGANATWGGRDP